jgi:hypothetical protein
MELCRKLEDPILKTEGAYKEWGLTREFSKSKSPMKSRDEILE